MALTQYSQRFREIREEKKITRRELSIKTNLTERSIQAYEAGEKVPSLYRAAAIADALGVSIDDLITRTPVEG